MGTVDHESIGTCIIRHILRGFQHAALSPDGKNMKLAIEVLPVITKSLRLSENDNSNKGLRVSTERLRYRDMNNQALHSLGAMVHFGVLERQEAESLHQGLTTLLQMPSSSEKSAIAVTQAISRSKTRPAEGIVHSPMVMQSMIRLSPERFTHSTLNLHHLSVLIGHLNAIENELQGLESSKGKYRSLLKKHDYLALMISHGHLTVSEAIMTLKALNAGVSGFRSVWNEKTGMNMELHGVMLKTWLHVFTTYDERMPELDVQVMRGLLKDKDNLHLPVSILSTLAIKGDSGDFREYQGSIQRALLAIQNCFSVFT